MGFWYPREGSKNDRRWWRALEDVCVLTRQSGSLPTIFACEFMMMGAITRARGGRIWLYKHIDTRRYLNVDRAGHAYRYIEPPDIEEDGWYVPHRRLKDALDDLELEIVPVDWRLERIRGCELCEPLLDGADLTKLAKS